MKRKWIANAIKRKGSLTASAKRLHMSPMAFARSHQHSPGVTGKRARLAMTLSKLRK